MSEHLDADPGLQDAIDRVMRIMCVRKSHRCDVHDDQTYDENGNCVRAAEVAILAREDLRAQCEDRAAKAATAKAHLDAVIDFVDPEPVAMHIRFALDALATADPAPQPDTATGVPTR
jgi:dihydrodipicolinate reductase